MLLNPRILIHRIPLKSCICKLGSFTSQAFDVFLRSFYADSSSPQISATLVGYLARENGSLRKSPQFSTKLSQTMRGKMSEPWLAKFPTASCVCLHPVTICFVLFFFSDSLRSDDSDSFIIHPFHYIKESHFIIHPFAFTLYHPFILLLSPFCIHPFHDINNHPLSFTLFITLKINTLWFTLLHSPFITPLYPFYHPLSFTLFIRSDDSESLSSLHYAQSSY